ncbi:MAG: hypothetical protein M1836_005721 [Candelina mexicana]|nr:MAG: hypothetical protein M1836_005721 [Candelina mexicana]
MSSSQPSSVSRSWLQARIEQYSDMLACFTLTPLLQEQLQHTRTIFRLACQDPAYVRSIDLVSLHTQLHEHWTSLFGSPAKISLTHKRLHLLREFLIRLLAEEYYSYLPSETTWTWKFVSLATKLEKFHDWKYWVEVGTRMKAGEEMPAFDNSALELFLSVPHTRTKVELYADGNGQPHSRIEAIIEECDWDGLASGLERDKEVIEKLHAFPAEKCDDLRDMLKAVAEGREEVKRLYFEEGGGVTAKAWVCEREREARRKRERERKTGRGDRGRRSKSVPRVLGERCGWGFEYDSRSA